MTAARLMILALFRLICLRLMILALFWLICLRLMLLALFMLICLRLTLLALFMLKFKQHTITPQGHAQVRVTRKPTRKPAEAHRFFVDFFLPFLTTLDVLRRLSSIFVFVLFSMQYKVCIGSTKCYHLF